MGFPKAKSTREVRREEKEAEKMEELESYFVEQGLRKETARSVVADLESHPDATSKLLSFHTRFHWGVEMDELGGSPAVAAVASFSIGAAAAKKEKAPPYLFY